MSILPSKLKYYPDITPYEFIGMPRGRGGGGPLTEDLIAYYQLEEVSGQRNDSYINALHLADNNTVPQGTGKVGDAALFTRASNEYLSRASESLLQIDDSDYTIALWARFDLTAEFQGLVSKWVTSTDYLLYKFNTHEISFLVDFDTGATAATTVTQVVDDTWYFILAEHDTTSNQLTISLDNAAPVTQGFGAGVPVVGADEFRLGQYAGQALDGTLDEVMFYNRILTAPEKAFLFNSGSGRSFAEVFAFKG